MALLAPFTTAEKTNHNSHKFGFTLSSTNYGYWKTMMQPFLVTNRLFGYIDGSIPCPNPTITIPPADKSNDPTIQQNPNHETWVSNDAHVRMLLLSTISEGAFQHVQGNSSRELWLALERAFAPNTSSREYTLKQQLQRIQMANDEAVTSYLTRAQAYADSLANIGEPVKEKDLVMHVLTGLREEYNSLKATILARQFPTAFAELYGLISDHDYMVKKPAMASPQAFTATTTGQPLAATSSIPNDTLTALQQLLSSVGLTVQSQSPQPQAMFASRGRGRNYSNRGRGGRSSFRSFNNNNGGNRGTFSWATNQHMIHGTCNRCGIAHIPSHCPNRDPNTSRSRQPTANYADHRSQSSNAWLPDTGSNSHVASDLHSLDNSEPYYGEDSLHVGNDAVSRSERMHNDHHLGDSEAQRVAQILWSTGKLDEPIPSGFYSILSERRLKEKYDMIPSLEELHALESEGFKLNVIVVDMQKDKKVSMLQQLALTLARGLTSNPAAVIKKIGGLVCDFYKLPNVELSYAKGAWEEVYNVHNQGIQMLGQIKHGFCHPRAILFKVLADTVGIDCRLMVGLPKEGEPERTDSHRHVSVIVELNSNELLVDIVRYPGHLVPYSTKAVYMSHVYVIGQGDSGENDSCDSPIEPNSPVHGAAENSDEGLLPGEPNKNALTEQSTPSSSPEHYLFRGHGRSILGGQRDTITTREPGSEMPVSRSAGASPVGSRRRRRRSSATVIPEIGDDIVRVVRAMNDTLKRNHSRRELVDEHGTSPDHQENACPSRNHRRQTSFPKAISLPTSPQKYRTHLPGSERSETGKLEGDFDMNTTWNNLLESTLIGNEPWFPYHEWNIDYSELTVGSRVGIGFFGEVFRGTWNGIEVAIKVLLEQEVTAENIEDFCNEISIISRLRHPNVILFLGACTTPPHFSLITEYMDMGSLYYLVHVSGLKKRISWRRRLKMLCDICRGLMCMHRMKIVHRDLKSANCLVNKHWIVKICDFGLSRVLTTEHMRDCSSAGTPEWMAPELIRNEAFTEKCDIFSLGVIIWELCTLHRPWEGIPSAQVVHAVGHDGTHLEIPEGPLGNLIADCWAEPDQRPNCEEILSRLLSCEMLI